MKKLPTFIFVSAIALLAAACTNPNNPPTPPVPDDAIVSAAGKYLQSESSATAAYVETTFTRKDGAQIIVPFYTKPLVDESIILASGTYTPDDGARNVLTFVPGSGETGARMENGDGTTPFDGGTIEISKSGQTYTVAIRLTGDDGDLSCDFVGPIALTDHTEYMDMDIFSAKFFDDYYDSGTMYWEMQLYSNLADKKQQGISMYINADPAQNFEAGLPTGIFTPSPAANRLPGTFVQGVVEGTSASGSLAYLLENGKQVPFVVTGGNMTVESLGGGKYGVVTSLELLNPDPAIGSRRISVRYEGTPEVKNVSLKNRTFNGVIESANAEYFGVVGNEGDSDRWVVNMAWKDELDNALVRRYQIEFYGPKGGSKTNIPTGTFNMAAAAGVQAEGTMEPGTGSISYGMKGTWFTTHQGNAINGNPRPAKPGVGTLTITAKGGGKYDITSYFEDDANNKFHGTYTNGALDVIDNGPQHYNVTTGWNGDGELNYNGIKEPGKRSNGMMAYLMTGTLNFGGNNGALQGAGLMAQIDFCIPLTETRNLPLGTYTRNTTQEPMTLGGMTCFYDYDYDNLNFRNWDVQSGTVNVVSRDGDTYKIEFDFVMTDTSTAKGTFVGTLLYRDDSALYGTTRTINFYKSQQKSIQP